jgi:hypothetical protein
MKAILAPCLLSASIAAHAIADPERPPDLGGRALNDLADDRVALPAGRVLTPRFDAALAPARRCDEPAGQLSWVGNEDDRAGSRRDEAARIAASGGALTRKDATLTLAPPDGAPLHFADWKRAGKRNVAEGDERWYVYAGQMPGSSYWRVEVHYGHDAPGTYLIAPAGRTAAFVHNGGRVSAVSADGKWLASFETLNAPYRLALAALEHDGPRVAVECRFEPAARADAGSCGWTAPAAFELNWGEVPLRLVREGDAWSIVVGAASAPVPLRCVAL